jgi:ParB-like chromosome segregation protein Spo0J
MFSQIAPLSKEERAEMFADIKENGIKVPLLVNKKKDTIYDGYTRWGIAYDLKLAPKDIPMDVFTGTEEEIEAAILSRNLFRRHMSDSERAALVSKILGPIAEKEAKQRQSAAGSFDDKSKGKGTGKGKRVAELAKKAGVSEHKMAQAEKARKAGMIDDVLSKKTTLRKASQAGGTRKKSGEPAKELSFADALYKKWTAFVNRIDHPKRRQALELIAGWCTGKKPSDKK